MIITINIKGEGTVNGGGEYEAGTTATITATPVNGYTFKYFKTKEGETKTNPLVIEIKGDTTDLIIEAVFYVTIEDYLRGQVDFEISDAALTAIKLDRGVKFSQDVTELDAKTKDLCYADVLMWATTTASTIQGEKDSDNGWSHQASSKTLSINDKKRLEERAIQIYKRYNDTKANITTNTISLRPL